MTSPELERLVGIGKLKSEPGARPLGNGFALQWQIFQF
jgi:hypothetical protein